MTDRNQPLVRCSCGSQCFERVTPIRGAWREYVVFDDDGAENVDKSESTTDDLIQGKAPKTMRCAECGKRRRNPDTPNEKSPSVDATEMKS